MVEMVVHRVGLCAQDGSPIVVLREVYGERLLPVKVSSLHANAVMRHSHHLPPFRPQTHEVFVALVHALGATITGAHIDALDQGMLSARLTVAYKGRTISLSASAADAVVLAIRGGAPVFVAPAVLDSFAQPQPHEDVNCAPLSPAEGAAANPSPTEDVFRQFIDTLTNLDDLGR